MRLLELFSGTQSVSKVAKELGWETLSVDIDPRHSPDRCVDILAFDETEYPVDSFQFIWASPPCESYSPARSNAKVDRADAMQLSDLLVTRTRQIIAYFGCHWCIENPAASLMWKREVANGLLESSCVTSYCSFGMLYRKSTRIANSFGLSLPICPGEGQCPAMIGSRHSEWAQRGTNIKRSGAAAQRNHSLDELHSIPKDLCLYILEHVYSFTRMSST